MKKFMLAVICIIPVIVVLALSVTGEIILSVTAQNPTGLTVTYSDGRLIAEYRAHESTDVTSAGTPASDIVEIDLKAEGEYLLINVLPGVVLNKNITWKLTEEEGQEGQIALERMGESENRYEMIPLKAGVCTMEIRAEDNYNVVVSVTFNITTKYVDELEVYRESTGERVARSDAEGAVGEVRTVSLSGAERFYLTAKPFSAYTGIDGRAIEWRLGVGSDETAIAVDNTGLVTPLNTTDELQTIEVSATSSENGTFTAYFYVDISAAKVRSTEAVCLEKGLDEEGMREWVKENLVISGTADVEYVGYEEPVWTFAVTESAPPAARAKEADAVYITVLESEAEFGFAPLPEILYAGNGDQVFSVIDYTTLDYASGKVIGEEIDGFEAVSSDESVLTVDVGKRLLCPKKAGKVTVTIRHNGQESSRTITVKERPVAFDLMFRRADSELGIARDRYWGSYWLSADNSELVTEFDFGLASQYATGAFEVQWTVSATDMNGVPVEEEELGDYVVMTVKEHSYEGVTLDFHEKAPGSDITVTAKLYMQNRVVEEVQRSFTFSFVEKKNAVNVYDFEDFKTVYKNYYTFDYVMQDNIVAENVTTDFLYDEDLHQHSRYKADNLDMRSGNVLTNMIGSIYGNGFMYDAAKVKVPENDQGALSYRFQSMYLKLTEMYAREHNGVKHSTAAELKEYMKEKGVDEITIYNVRFRGAETLEEAEGTLGVICYMMGSRFFFDESTLDDATIYTNYNNTTDVDAVKDIGRVPRDPPMAIRYCELFNSERGIQLERVNDVLIEGCILGDNYTHSVFGYTNLMPLRRYPNYYYNDRNDLINGGTTPNTYTDDRRPGYNLTLRNNVFKRTTGPALAFSALGPPGRWGEQYSEENLANSKGEFWGYHSAAINLYVEGAMEIYNWKKQDEFKTSLRELIKYYILLAAGGKPEFEGLLEALDIDKILDQVVRDFIELDSNEDFYYNYAGDKYVGFGFFGIGCMYPWDFDAVHISEESASDVRQVAINMRDSNGVTPPSIEGIEELARVFVKGLSTCSETCAIICNNFAAGAPEIGPDDPVPSSEAMYDKLTAAKGDEMPWDKFGS